MKMAAAPFEQQLIARLFSSGGVVRKVERKVGLALVRYPVLLLVALPVIAVTARLPKRVREAVDLDGLLMRW